MVLSFFFWIYIVHFLFMFLFTVLHLCAPYYEKKLPITIPSWHTGCSLLHVVLLTVDLVLNLQDKDEKMLRLEESGADACIDEYFLHDSGSCNNNKYYTEQKGIVAESLHDVYICIILPGCNSWTFCVLLILCTNLHNSAMFLWVFLSRVDLMV